jgi:hypothetical protein
LARPSPLRLPLAPAAARFGPYLRG